MEPNWCIQSVIVQEQARDIITHCDVRCSFSIQIQGLIKHGKRLLCAYTHEVTVCLHTCMECCYTIQCSICSLVYMHKWFCSWHWLVRSPGSPGACTLDKRLTFCRTVPQSLPPSCSPAPGLFSPATVSARMAAEVLKQLIGGKDSYACCSIYCFAPDHLISDYIIR